MKGKKCVKLLVLSLSAAFSWVFISSFSTSDVSAVSITNGIYSTAIYTKNFETTKTVYNQGPLNIGSGAISAFNEVNPTGIWDYTQALSFSNPYSDKTGTGYVSSLYFTMHSTNGPFLNSQIKYIMANSNLGFEGLSEDLPYCSQSYEVRVQDSSTVQFLLRSSCPYGSYSTGTTFDRVEALIDYSPESIFWCANDNPSQMCGSYMGVTVYNIDYYFGLITSQEDSYNQTIINQNQTIINNQNELNDWFKDDTPPDVDTSVISGASGWLPQGPVDSLLTLPMTFAQGIVEIFTGQHQCSPIVLPFDFINSSITIPCLDTFFNMSGVNLIWNGVGTIISAFVLYDTFKWLYKFVDDTLTFRENNSGLWGGL